MGGVDRGSLRCQVATPTSARWSDPDGATAPNLFAIGDDVEVVPTVPIYTVSRGGFTRQAVKVAVLELLRKVGPVRLPVRRRQRAVRSYRRTPHPDPLPVERGEGED